MSTQPTPCVVAIAVLLCISLSANAPVSGAEEAARQSDSQILIPGESAKAFKQATFFALDDHWIPMTRGLELRMQTPQKTAENPVVRRGASDAPDAKRASCPAVIQRNGKWHMWYAAMADDNSSRVAYAESRDGISWEKPNINLVRFRGSAHNNIVRLDGNFWTVAVLADESAPADRRFILAGEDISGWESTGGWSLSLRKSVTAIATSPDGLHWRRIAAESPIRQQNETATIYKFQGKYHVGGHQISPLLRLPMQKDALGGYLGPRTFVVWSSPTLERWPLENVKAFYKPQTSSSPQRTTWDREEVHLGATVTAFENVCIGIYGQWHHPVNLGPPQYHAERVSTDLGLIISNDGLHFREPAPGYAFIRRDQELTWDRQYKAPSAEQNNLMLMQGPVVNTPTKTHIYYDATTPGGNTDSVSGNIGMATLERDRFAALQTLLPGSDGQFVSCPIKLRGKYGVYLNADVGAEGRLRLALTDEHGLDELPGYTFADCDAASSGLDVPVRWGKNRSLPQARAVRIRGELRGATKLYALYVRALDQ